MTAPVPAATVIVLRPTDCGIETFLVRRCSRSAFLPDVFVFPGGRVEPDDHLLARGAALRGTRPPTDPAFAIAAARETFEEAGLLFAADAVAPAALAAARAKLAAGTSTFAALLVELGTAVDAGALRYFSNWITPPGESRRFDTRFFVARAPDAQNAEADAVETHDGRWIAPRDALARHAAGTLALMLPTIAHLERLASFHDVDDVLDYAARKTIAAVLPEVGAEGGFRVPPELKGAW